MASQAIYQVCIGIGFLAFFTLGLSVPQWWCSGYAMIVKHCTKLSSRMLIYFLCSSDVWGYTFHLIDHRVFLSLPFKKKYNNSGYNITQGKQVWKICLSPPVVFSLRNELVSQNSLCKHRLRLKISGNSEKHLSSLWGRCTKRESCCSYNEKMNKQESSLVTLLDYDMLYICTPNTKERKIAQNSSEGVRIHCSHSENSNSLLINFQFGKCGFVPFMTCLLVS